jgi:hypothetical protein
LAVLGHEVDAAQHDDVGVRARRFPRQGQRVPVRSATPWKMSGV